MTGEQIRAARAILKWSAKKLAEESGISWPTIQRLESKNGPIGGYGQTGEAIKNSLESAGVQFLENGETALGVGVALGESED